MVAFRWVGSSPLFNHELGWSLLLGDSSIRVVSGGVLVAEVVRDVL